MKSTPAFAALFGVIGATLWPHAADAHAQATTTVQFDREIVHILDDHCVMCHAAGGLSFPLVTYEQAYAARWQIRQDALDRHMAPWAATLGTGDFANDNSLTQREIDFLVSWAESFGPRNNGEVYAAAAAPAARKVVQAHIAADRWALGQPDLLLALSANTTNPGEPDAIRRVVIDPKLVAARWLRGLEYKPGDNRVVRSVSFTIQETGQWIGSWTPWYGFVNLPAGLAYRLPAGAHLVAEIRYVRSTQAAVDQGVLGLYFAGSPSVREVTSFVLEPTATVSGAVESPQRSRTQILHDDLNILAFQPRLGPGLKSIEVAARMSDGSRQVLLFAQDLPLQWPTPYVFSMPVALGKGTELTVVEHYSADTLDPARASDVTFSAFAGAALATGQPQARQSPVPTRRFKLAGTVQSVDAAGQRLTIRHGDIPGFMGAMTMSYDVGRHEDLQKVAAGDEIQSEVVLDESGTHLENINVTRKPN